MQRILFFFGSVVLCVLALPGAGIAEDWVNRVGIYTDEAASSASLDLVGAEATLYVVLQNPASAGQPLTELAGFAFALRAEPNFAVLWRGFVFPPANLCDTLGFLNFCGGFDPPLPIVNGAVTLLSMRVIPQIADEIALYLEPHWEDTMVFIDGDLNVLVPMYPSNSAGDVAQPVFVFNGEPLAEVSTTWGGIKALYRN